jgi:Secretion system C-terminal sorting domain
MRTTHVIIGGPAVINAKWLLPVCERENTILEIPEERALPLDTAPEPETRIVITPNPANTSIQLTLPDITGQCRIMDGMGRIHWQSAVHNNQNINIADWPAGIYFVQYYQQDGVPRIATFIKI